MPIITSATEIQRQFRIVAKRAKRTKKPVVVLSNNKPEGVYMDYNTFMNEFNKKILPLESKKADFSDFRGIWTASESEKFNRIIEDAFEEIDPNDWK